MTIFANGQLVSPALIQDELARLGNHPRFTAIPDETLRRDELYKAAERTAIERVLIAHAAATDRRSINHDQIETEVQRQKEAAGCRAAFHDGRVRFEVDQNLRVERLMNELTAAAEPVTEDDVRRYYEATPTRFTVQAVFQSAQVICNVNERRSEQEALDIITAALRDLEAGDAFEDVAERHSDCKGNGGLLPSYEAGEMVADYEEAVHALEPGQRTGIFATPFGFHIAELRAKRLSHLASFSEARESIRESLTYERKRAAYAVAVERLWTNARIRRTGEDAGC